MSDNDDLGVTDLNEALQALREIETPDSNIPDIDPSNITNNGSKPAEKTETITTLSATSASGGIETPETKTGGASELITEQKPATIYTQETLPYNNVDSASPADIVRNGGEATMIFDQDPANQGLSAATVAVGIDPDSPDQYTFTITELNDGNPSRLAEMLKNAEGYDTSEPPLGQSFSIPATELDTGLWSNFMNAESVILLDGDMDDNAAKLNEISQDQDISNGYLSNEEAPTLQTSNTEFSIKP